MKKFYLPLVAAATLFGANVAFAADEPTLTEIWSNITDWEGDAWGGIPASIDWSASNDMMGISTGTRWGVGVNGKIYAVNERTMSIMAFDADGYRDVYKLPSLAGKTITYNAANADFTQTTSPDFYGTLISRDDAGHFIVGHGFTTGAMPCTWTVYDPASGKGKTFYKDDLGFEGAPAESFMRIDAVGRVLGDVLKYGVMWVAPTGIYWGNIKGLSWATDNNVQHAKIIEFTGEGELDDDLSATGYVTSKIYLGNNLSTVCQPRYNTIEELQAKFEEDGDNTMKTLTEGYYMYSKAEEESVESNKYALVMGIQPYGGTVGSIIDNLAETDLAKNYSGYVGFDTFTLGGKRYYATFYQTKEDLALSAKMMKVGVFDENGMLVAEWNNPAYASSYGRGAISTELIADDENSAYIYVFAQTGKIKPVDTNAVGVAQLKFTAADAAGISDVVVDENTDAPAVYYNLQGVKVANPENGIYLVRRGNKVVKELVK